MIRRFFSSNVDKFTSCNDCYKFNSKLNSCSLNNNYAYVNRNNDVCGKIPKHFVHKNTYLISCNHCKFYDENTATCLAYKPYKPAIDNRTNSFRCGPTGNNFNEIDYTHLHKSYTYKFYTFISLIATYQMYHMKNLELFTYKFFMTTTCFSVAYFYFKSHLSVYRHREANKIDKKIE